MRKSYLLLFLIILAINFSKGYTWAQPLPKAEGQSYEASSNGTKEEAESEQINEEPVAIRDPLERYNRSIFTFNDKFYFHALKPLVKGYRRVVPERVRISLKNFYSNLNMPMRFVNCLLQGKLQGAGTEALRLSINSTIGVAGLFDPAKKYFCLEKKEEDFGQTLGRYGMGPDFYIEWPFLGPLNLRDTLGFAGDVALQPLTYLTLVGVPFGVGFGAWSYDYVNLLSLDKDTYESITESAIDPYLAVQDAYIKNRNKWIKE